MATDMIPTVTTTAPFAWSLTYGEYIATVEKIAKINERAQKRGFTGRLEVVAERVEKTHTNQFTGIEQTEIFWSTRVTGEAPSYGGFTFLARVDRVGDTFTLATAPGVDHIDRSMVQVGVCDHCGLNRQRNNTYLVRNDANGLYANVGSTCIKDFLGWSGSVVFFSDTDMEPVEGGMYYTPTYALDSVIAVAVAAIRAHGWVPSSSYDAMPTKDMVALALSSRTLNDREQALVRPIAAHRDEALALVPAIIGYITSDEFSGASNYVENLKAVFTQTDINGRQFGLVVSAPNAYTRHLGLAAERKAAAAKTEGSVWVGAEKDKVEVKGTIEAINYLEGQYGTTTIYKILGQDGNLYTWFSSNGALGDDTNVEVHIKGTVKTHDEYRGVKSTVLTRCKAI